MNNKNYSIKDMIDDINYDIESKHTLTYFELIYDVSHGLKDPNYGTYTVINSDDERTYIFINGDLVSDDSSHIKFEDMYKNCNIENIKLKEKEKQSKSKNIKYNKDKYYTQDEFLNTDTNINSNTNLSGIDAFEYDTWDTTPRKIARAKAKQEVITILEKMYIDLDLELDACQGCTINLNQAFEKLNIYEELIRYLGGNLEADKPQLIEKVFEEARDNEDRRNEIIKRIKSDLELLSDL